MSENQVNKILENISIDNQINYFNIPTMGDENLFEFLHFEIVNYCVNEKKVKWIQFYLKIPHFMKILHFRIIIQLNLQ